MRVRFALLLIVLACVAAPVRAADAPALAREFLSALKAGDFEKAVSRFDATMKAAMSVDTMKQTWAQLGAQVGELKSEGVQRTAVDKGYTVVFQRLSFANADLEMRVAVSDATGEIGGLFFTPPSEMGTPVGGAPAAAPATPAGPAADPREVSGALLAALKAGDFEGASKHFDGALASMVTPDKLAGIWADLGSRLGVLKQAGEPAVQDAVVNQIVTTRLVFAAGALDMNTTVARDTGRIVGLYFAPVAAESAPPPADAAFTESAVEVGEGGGKLGGTLTMPRATAPFPLVVLVHGSGPHDRDETIGPNKPFRDIAWGLAERGIAVLRYDKRTYAHGTALAPMSGDLTLENETILDAVAAAKLARTLPGIDPKRIVVAGHSLGGTALPRIAGRAPGLAGLVFLAGSSEPMADAILRQTRYIAMVDGTIDADEQKAINMIEGQVALANSPTLSKETPAGLLPLGVPALYWLDLRAHDPAKEAAQLPLPMLFVQGGRDYQVTTADLDRFRKAIGPRKDVRFLVLPKLNHLFMAGEAKSGPNDYLVEGHVDPQVLDAIAAFVKGLPAS